VPAWTGVFFADLPARFVACLLTGCFAAACSEGGLFDVAVFEAACFEVACFEVACFEVACFEVACLDTVFPDDFRAAFAASAWRWIACCADAARLPSPGLPAVPVRVRLAADAPEADVRAAKVRAAVFLLAMAMLGREGR
jgi:hypothetical protein